MTDQQTAATIAHCTRTMQRYHFGDRRSPQAHALMAAEVNLHAAWIGGLDPEAQRAIYDSVAAGLVDQCGHEVGLRLAAEFAEAVASAGPE